MHTRRLIFIYLHICIAWADADALTIVVSSSLQTVTGVYNCIPQINFPLVISDISELFRGPTSKII